MTLKELRDKHDPDKGRDALSRYYVEAYERHFSSFREDTIRFLEIGVQSGASLRMWADYFPNAEIVGMDINKNCRKHETDRLKIVIGDQANRKFLDSLGHFDIIIDDGGHMMKQQVVSFVTLWPKVTPGGIYVVEDLETSYWPEFGGGLEKPKTMVELLKRFVDNLNCLAIAHKRAKKRLTLPGHNIKSVCFYPSICFITKESRHV